MKVTECEGQTSLFSVVAFPHDESPASQYPLPGSAEAVKITVSSGRKCIGLSKSSGPLGWLERMLLVSSVWNSTIRLLTWKVQATPAGRSYFQLVPSGPPTDGIEWRFLPTIVATDGHRNLVSPQAANYQFCTLQRELARRGHLGRINPNWVEAVMGFPRDWTRLDWGAGKTACPS